MSRPIMSWDTSVSTFAPPATFMSGSLSMSRTSARMWPFMQPYRLCRDSSVLRVFSSASFALPELARMMIALAMCTLTWMRSGMSTGEPHLKTTLVPRRCRAGSCISSSNSMTSLSTGASTATRPPPSLSFALQSSSMMWVVFSVHPSINVWSFSMILDLPCRMLSIFSRIMSTVTPRIDAKKRMPHSAMALPTIRSHLLYAFACVPGSAMNVHASQSASPKLPNGSSQSPSSAVRTNEYDTPPTNACTRPQVASATKNRQRRTRMRSKK
mmetsp:Transcript_61273/g.172776  ORF Transcript_61273/g.172776 Transcript_61273/m.172776 type:complete len:270 (+) Transcript_61273:541-1350(+)